jgi:hypothetical protein
MLTLAELLPEKTIRRLELLKQKQPAIKKQLEEPKRSKTEVIRSKNAEIKKVATKESPPEKTRIVEDLARNPQFTKAVWRGQERKVRKIVKDELRRQNVQIRRNFWWIYLEATRAAAMLPVGKSAGRKAAVAG